MKKCGWCGRENANQAEACSECGTTFAAPKVIEQKGEQVVPSLTRHSKIALIFAAWALALLAMFPLWGLLLMQPSMVFLIPAGLFKTGEPKSWNVIAGWAFYTAITTALMRAKVRSVFIGMYVILILALIFNVAGCYKIAGDALREIH